MKTAIKLVSILLIMVLLISATSFTFASDVDPDKYDPSKDPLKDEDNKKVGKIVGNILAYIRAFGAILAVIAASLIGLKYILGSLEEKANYKENAIPYVVGIFILVGATSLPAIIWDLAH